MNRKYKMGGLEPVKREPINLIKYDAKINKIYEKLENCIPNQSNDWVLDIIIYLLKGWNVSYAIPDYLEQYYRGKVDDQLLNDAIVVIEKLEINRRLFNW